MYPITKVLDSFFDSTELECLVLTSQFDGRRERERYICLHFLSFPIKEVKYLTTFSGFEQKQIVTNGFNVCLITTIFQVPVLQLYPNEGYHL